MSAVNRFAEWGQSLVAAPGNISQSEMDELRLDIPKVRWCLWLLTTIVIAITVIPSVYLIVWATRGTGTIGQLGSNYSFKWFSTLLTAPQWRQSILYSSILGVSASAIGVSVLVTHFYFMRFAAPAVDRISYGNVVLTVTIPAVIYALALKVLGSRLHVGEVALLATGNLLATMPMQFFVLESVQEAAPSELLCAGCTLGASHLRNLMFVYLPQIRKSVWIVFICGFLFSFDELVIATFIIDSPMVTVPRKLWDAVPNSMEPFPAVIATLLITMCLAIWTVSCVWQYWRSRRAPKRT